MRFSGLVDKQLKDEYRNTHKKEPIHYSRKTLEGTDTDSIFEKSDKIYDTAMYSLNIIKLLDLAIITDDLHVLSVDQQRFIEEYFKEAGSFNYVEEKSSVGTYYEPTDFEEKYEDYLMKVFKDLDAYLGSYYGECYGRQK